MGGDTTLTLPQLVSCRLTKWIYFLVGGASTLILYQWTNRNPIFEPQLLSFGPIDEIMPFWTWTVWIYFTEYIIFLCAYFGLRKKENVTRYFYAYMAILLISIVIFMIYPVTFPRYDYPVTGSSISDDALAFLRKYLDSPGNCLPSLHVSSCYISSLCFWKESKSKASWYMAWSTLVAISTMTTKQHYFVDVWTAMILTGICYWFFFYVVKFPGSGSSEGAKL